MKKIVKYLSFLIISITSAITISNHTIAMEKPNFDNDPPLSTASTARSAIGDDFLAEFQLTTKQLVILGNKITGSLTCMKKTITSDDALLTAVKNLLLKTNHAITGIVSEYNTLQPKLLISNQSNSVADFLNKAKKLIKNCLKETIELDSKTFFNQCFNIFKHENYDTSKKILEITKLLTNKYDSQSNYLNELYKFFEGTLYIEESYNNYKKQLENIHENLIEPYINSLNERDNKLCPENASSKIEEIALKLKNIKLEIVELLFDTEHFSQIKC